jgi:hypothetical protein
VYSIQYTVQYVVTDVFSFFSKLEALDSLPLGVGKVYTVHYDFLLFKYTTNFRQEKTMTSGTLYCKL